MLIDSKVSLEFRNGLRDSLSMIQQPYHLYAERTDPSKNMARYYAMEISETLFGEPCLARRWGRIGSAGQSLVHHFECENDAVRLFLKLARQKKARGYRPKSAGRHPSH
jgi:predicted DNA-binding WGR domain protein